MTISRALSESVSAAAAGSAAGPFSGFGAVEVPPLSGTITKEADVLSTAVQPVQAVTVSPDGLFLLTAGFYTSRLRMQSREFSTPFILTGLTGLKVSEIGDFVTFAHGKTTSDGKYILYFQAAGANTNIRIRELTTAWDINGGNALRSAVLTGVNTAANRISPDGTKLLTVGGPNELYQTEITTPFRPDLGFGTTVTTSIITPAAGGLRELEFSADGKWMLICFQIGAIQICKLAAPWVIAGYSLENTVTIDAWDYSGVHLDMDQKTLYQGKTNTVQRYTYTG